MRARQILLAATALAVFALSQLAGPARAETGIPVSIDVNLT